MMNSQLTVYAYAIIQEIGRELAVRKVFYEKQIHDGKMTKDDANNHYLRLQAAQYYVAGEQEKATKTHNEALSELQREIGMRGRVYPNLVARNIMTEGESRRRTTLLQQAMTIITETMPKPVPENPNQLNLFD